MKRWIRVFALLMVVMLLGACAPKAADTTPAGGDAVSFLDMGDNPISFDGPVERVIALLPGDCEILYAIGAGETLVGRGEYCDYPEKAASVPSVGTGGNFNVEQIVALSPQAVIIDSSLQTSEEMESLKKAGIVPVVSCADDIQGVYTAIKMLGMLTGHDGEAAQLIDTMQTSFEGIQAGIASSDKTVYFEVSPLEYGLWTAGTGTFMNELCDMLGLQNAFADVEGWAEISQEQVIARNPDYIVTITMYSGAGALPEEEILERKGWEQIKAVENGAVFNADNNEIARPGPRLVDAAKALKTFFYGA